MFVAAVQPLADVKTPLKTVNAVHASHASLASDVLPLYAAPPT
jgi:hypothetical protein